MRYLQDSVLVTAIERSKKELIDSLAETYLTVGLSGLRELAERIEDEITGRLLDTIYRNAPLLLSLTPSSDGLHLVGGNGELYKLISSFNITEPKQFIICLQSLTGLPEKCGEFYVDIDGYGRYTQVLLLYPARVADGLNNQLIYSWVKAIVETGYLWFVDKAGKITNVDLPDLAADLYAYIRRYLLDEASKTKLWFSAIADGWGFRLIDPSLATQAFAKFKAHNELSAYSTNRYVAELLSTYLPESIMLMRTAIDGGECIDVNLRDAQYTKSGSIYALTMTTLYGCESFTVFPVYKGERLSVGGVFDTENRSMLEPLLGFHKSELVRICREHLGEIRPSYAERMRRKAVSFLDTVELKPNIVGIGIDLKRLIALLFGRQK
jgi:hypothetical protein